jgi:hypothetical protein
MKNGSVLHLPTGAMLFLCPEYNRRSGPASTPHHLLSLQMFGAKAGEARFCAKHLLMS